MTKQELLASTTFGARVAEEEGEELSAYFVETDQWKRVFSGEVDVIYGPKGSGKSAIYSLIVDRRAELLVRRITVIPAENPRGTAAFKELIVDPPASEHEFRALWKLYLISLIAEVMRRPFGSNEAIKKIVGTLEQAKLLPQDTSLSSKLKAVRDYVRRLVRPESIEGGIRINPATGLPEGITGKITLSEPSAAEREAGIVSADDLLELVNDVLAAGEQKLWLIFDRLDVAFADNIQLETNALRALFRVYLDLIPLKQISMKIFLRNDIWSRIMNEPFPEASHITRTTEISWTKNSFLNLVVRRLLHNEAVVSYYKVTPEQVLAKIDSQVEFFYRLFPPKVDLGPNKPVSLDWILSRTADGSRESTPREVIHLISSALEKQLGSLEIGVAEPPGDLLVDRASLKEALPTVSKARFEQTLCAEFPQFREPLEKLKKAKTTQTPSTLGKIWGVSEDAALRLANKLSEVGFFERRGSKDAPSFWVPFLYRSALSMIQGAAK